MDYIDYISRVEKERDYYKAELDVFELDRAELNKAMREYPGESKYNGMLWSYILRDLIQENATLEAAVLSNQEGIRDLNNTVLTLLSSNKKMAGVLEECQRLFQNIKDYGAMGSPSDWEKVQYVWSRVNDALATTKETDNG